VWRSTSLQTSVDNWAFDVDTGSVELLSFQGCQANDATIAQPLSEGNFLATGDQDGE